MFEIALYILVSAQPVSDVQFMDLEGLSPQEMGGLILGGEKNAEIIEVERHQFHLQPPGFAFLRLYERPTRLNDECQRKQWDVSFHLGLRGMRGKPGLRNIYATNQVALSPSKPCEFAEYTSISGNLTTELALNALNRLKSIKLGNEPATFDCHDATESNLCKSPEIIRSSLRSAEPWHVKREGSRTILWINSGGLTEVSLSDQERDPIMVSRRKPLPF